MAAQHTPGSWEVCGYYVRGPYAMGSHEKPGLLVATLDSSGDEMRANARLIAAAPDLLAALIEMRDLFDLMCGLGFNPAEGRVGSPKAIADAAIAKATGEQA